MADNTTSTSPSPASTPSSLSASEPSTSMHSTRAFPSRKQLRKGKKEALRQAQKAALRQAQGPAQAEQHNDPVSPIEEAQPNVAEIYECDICMDEVSVDEFIPSCAAHVVCNTCVPILFSRALDNIDEFPASCCTGHNLKLCLYKNLLPRNTTTKYAERATEHFTKPRLRVYCSNPECRQFVPKSNFRYLQWSDVADCHACGTSTCVGCKGEWRGEGHLCDDSSDGELPDWLPKYTAECRIKKCPGCGIFLEHRDACNHFTCSFCGHQFCFICLTPWEGNHDACPTYGDPECGYDEEGFELSDRGIHLMSGLSRDGVDADGQRRTGLADLQEEAAADRPGHRGWYLHEDGWYHYEDDDENDVQPLEGVGVVADLPPDQVLLPEDDPVQPPPDPHETREWRDEPIGHPDGVDLHVEAEAAQVEEPAPEPEPAEAGNDDDVNNNVGRPATRRRNPRRPRVTPAEIRLNFVHAMCRHSWDYRLAASTCQVCDWHAPYFHYRCDACRIDACENCMFYFEAILQFRGLDNMVTPLQWAEQGAVPFRALDKEENTAMQRDDAEWYVSRMFDVYESIFLERHPFLYADFGLGRLFGDAEDEARWNGWGGYRIVEDVGLFGYTFSFGLYGNPFAALTWEGEREDGSG